MTSSIQTSILSSETNKWLFRAILLLLWVAISIILAHSVIHADGEENHPDCPLCKLFGGLTPIPENTLLVLLVAFLLLHTLYYINVLIPRFSKSGLKSTRSPPLCV